MIERGGVTLEQMLGQSRVDLIAGEASGAEGDKVLGPLDRLGIVAANVGGVVDENVAFKKVGEQIDRGERFITGVFDEGLNFALLLAASRHSINRAYSGENS